MSKPNKKHVDIAAPTSTPKNVSLDASADKYDFIPASGMTAEQAIAIEKALVVARPVDHANKVVAPVEKQASEAYDILRTMRYSLLVVNPSIQEGADVLLKFMILKFDDLATELTTDNKANRLFRLPLDIPENCHVLFYPLFIPHIRRAYAFDFDNMTQAERYKFAAVLNGPHIVAALSTTGNTQSFQFTQVFDHRSESSKVASRKNRRSIDVDLHADTFRTSREVYEFMVEYCRYNDVKVPWSQSRVANILIKKDTTWGLSRLREDIVAAIHKKVPHKKDWKDFRQSLP